MSGDDDVDPENPRPEGHYPRFRDNEWHYIPEELAQTISLGPGGNGEEGQDWVLTYTPEKRDPEDREKVLVRLTPRALHELYIEVKDLDVETRQMGHRAECDLCGELVDLDRAIPNDRGERVTNAVGLSTSVLPIGSQITSDIGQSGEGLNTIEQQPLVAPTRRAFLFEDPLPREVLMIGLVD